MNFRIRGWGLRIKQLPLNRLTVTGFPHALLSDLLLLFASLHSILPDLHLEIFNGIGSGP
jgi:hypothetical protein